MVDVVAHEVVVDVEFKWFGALGRILSQYLVDLILQLVPKYLMIRILAAVLHHE